MKRNQKWKIPRTVLERRTLFFTSYKNHKLKVKLWWVGARKRKKRTLFVLLILSEGNFFKICVLSQWIDYWIHFQNLNTFTYQKTLLHIVLYEYIHTLYNCYIHTIHTLLLCCLFLKSLKAFSVSLMPNRRKNSTFQVS